MRITTDQDTENYMTAEPAHSKPFIRPIQGLNELRQVYRLTHDCYVARGYAAPQPSGLLVHYPQFDHIPQTTILVALQEGRVVGSVSATVDGPMGFTLEDEFKTGCDKLRAEGRQLATIWRLVVQQSARSQRHVVMGLIDGMASHLKDAEVNSYLFAVNPRHETVYQRMLHMEAIERTSHTEGLNNAPAVLLHGYPEDIPQVRASKMFRQAA